VELSGTDFFVEDTLPDPRALADTLPDGARVAVAAAPATPVSGSSGGASSKKGADSKRRKKARGRKRKRGRKR
jgi:hypothetical protein